MEIKSLKDPAVPSPYDDKDSFCDGSDYEQWERGRKAKYI